MTREEFTDTYERTRAKLTRLARYWMRHSELRENADDAVQQAFIAMLEPADNPRYVKYTAGPDFDSLMAVSVRARAADMVKTAHGVTGKRIGRVKRETAWAEQNTPVVGPEFNPAPVLSALSSLSRETQTIVRRCWVDGEEYAIVAQDLGISTHRIQRVLSRARSRLRVILRRTLGR